MELNNTKPSYKRHEDDDWIDEIKIVTVPRYKTSGMSGDEWRFSARVQLWRKGHLMFERSFSKLHYAIDFLPASWEGNAELGAKAAESPSASISVPINSLDELPAAIQKAKEAHNERNDASS